MTALKDSGMHVVFTFPPTELHRIVHHLFFLEYYFMLPPEGYDCYYLEPARMPGDVDHETFYEYGGIFSEWCRSVLYRGRSGPEFKIPVHLVAEPSGPSGGVDLDVTFGVDAYLEGAEVCVSLTCLGVTPDVEGVNDVLASRSPLRWWMSLDGFSTPDLPLVPTDVAKTFVTWARNPCTDEYGWAGSVADSERLPAVAIGVAMQDIPGADPDRFRSGIDLTENPEREYLCSQISNLPQVAISSEVATRLLDLFVQDVLDRELAGEHVFGIDEHEGFDYRITELEYRWPSSFLQSPPDSTDFHQEGTYVFFRASGQIHFLGEWRDMELHGIVEFNRRRSLDDARTRFNMVTILPANLHLSGSWYLEPELHREILYRTIQIDSRDSYSPSANITVRPDSLRSEIGWGSDTSPFELVAQCRVDGRDFDLDTAAISVSVGGDESRRELDIEFTYQYTEHFKTCAAAAPGPQVEGNRWGSFRVSNTGGVPVQIALTTDRSDLLTLGRGGSSRLAPGEVVDINVGFRTETLPPFYNRAHTLDEFYATVHVKHSLCDVETIDVRVGVHVTYEFHRHVYNIPDSLRNALCGWADVMMFKYGIIALGDDRFDDHPDYTPIYTVGIRDESDRYEFVAHDEAGNTVAMEATHSLHKTMQIPVAEDDSIPLSVRYRTSGEPAKGPFYWTLRGFFIQPTAEVKIDGLHALAPFSGGAVAVGPAGVFLLDTTAPKRSTARLALKDELALVDVASSKTDIYAVGNDRLLNMTVSGEGKIEVVQAMTLRSSAHLIRQLGNRLWIAGDDELTVLTHQHGKEIERVATTKLKAPSRDISVHRGRVTLLVDGGLHFYAFDGAELKLTGSYALKDSANAALTARGELVGVTDPKKGTFFLDVSHSKEPEVIATYAKPYWKSNLAADIRRGITYSADPRTETATIGWFRTLKIRG